MAQLKAPAMPARARAPLPEQLVRLPGGGFRVRLAGGPAREPSGTYNFVQLHGSSPGSQPIFLSPQLTHAQLAQGKPVVYAGTARFDKGAMQWWSNYSGTYQPIAAFHAQAKLPGEHFVPWQQLQLGGHAMQRSMLGERRSQQAPDRVPARTSARGETPAGTDPGQSAGAGGRGNHAKGTRGMEGTAAKGTGDGVSPDRSGRATMDAPMGRLQSGARPPAGSQAPER
ncbi:MAG: hypothetical protein IPK66_09005 [Rhodospirillales bacterium]|nr:hypothetical protein [Rhodospirillales bacterium]